MKSWIFFVVSVIAAVSSTEAQAQEFHYSNFARHIAVAYADGTGSDMHTKGQMAAAKDLWVSV